MVFTLSVFAEDNYMKEDGTFDWENYLEHDVKRKAYNDTNTLIQLFNYYDTVKDDPFSLSTLSNDIVTSIYNQDYFFYNYDVSINNEYGDYVYDDDGNSYYDIDTNRFYNIYQIIYDNIDKFDIENSRIKKDSLEWFLNKQIHEVKLFIEIHSAYSSDYAEDKNKLFKIELRNSDDEVNGLIIKHNGKVVPGILGHKIDYEYTIDYNGKKDVTIKYAKIRINTTDNGFFDVDVLLIGKSNYYAIDWNSDYGDKIRDFNNHEDGITSVEIIK